MFLRHTIVKLSNLTLSLKAAVEFAEKTGATKNYSHNKKEKVKSLTQSPLSFSSQIEQEHLHWTSKKEHKSSYITEECYAPSHININTPLFTCANPLRLDNNIEYACNTVKGKATRHSGEKCNTRRSFASSSHASISSWQRYVEMEQEEIYNDMHRTSDAELAASAQINNQILIEGVVHSVYAGCRPHHGIINDSANTKESHKLPSCGKTCSSHELRENYVEMCEVRKTVNVLSIHRVNALLVQVWLYCQDDEDLDLPVTPLAVCSYITREALAANYNTSNNINNNNNNNNNDNRTKLVSGNSLDEFHTETLTVSAAPITMTNFSNTSKTNKANSRNESVNNEETATMLHMLVTELEEMLVLKPFVVRGSLKMEMFFDGDVNRPIQVPVIWVPDNAIKSAFYQLPISQKRQLNV